MKKLMAGNWKMYKTAEEAGATMRELCGQVSGKLGDDREILIFPPFTALSAVREALGGHDGCSMGGQDFYPAQEGAFTGEIAPGMLINAGCLYGLTGHSERRHVLGETDEFVGQKTAFGLQAGLNIILCIGELLEEREAGRVEAVLSEQLEKGLADVAKDISPDRLCVAYEPVWAIGTGKVAGPEEIVEAHAFVREKLTSLLTEGAGIRILYGGSVKPGNASQILGLDNVNGVLVGGASLTAESFSQIVLA